MSNLEPTAFRGYRFYSNYSFITFSVPGQADWSEEQWDSVAQSDLEDYVTTPEQYNLDDCWEIEDGVETYETYGVVGV